MIDCLLRDEVNMKSTLKLYYLKIVNQLPVRFVERFEILSIQFFDLLARLETWQAIRSGPPYHPSHRKIIIDITTSCNLGCIDCNRSCGQGQAPSDEHMSIAQVERFIKESVEQRRRWKEIALEGGEPTLHPQLSEILKLLLLYRRKYSPRTNIKILTNGFGKKAKEAIASLHHLNIDIYNSRKTSIVQKNHLAFNIAPCDVQEFQNVDFSQGCCLPACYGVGLTKYGYYPHPICGGIDRVFGFNIGRKNLPSYNDLMTDQFTKLCRLCGFFRHSIHFRSKRKNDSVEFDHKGPMSMTWQQAYSSYRQENPTLKEYR